MKKHLLGLLALFLFSSAAGASATVEDQVKSIQALYATAQQRIQSKDYQAAHFKSGLEDGRWKKADGKPNKEEEIGKWADVYSNEGGIFYIKLETAPPSGDWSCVSDYYFQPDQSLAFIYTEVRTFGSVREGGVLAALRHYYDRGKLLRKTEQEFALENPKQPVPKKEWGYFNVGCPFIYSEVSRFPFYSLLKGWKR